MRARYFFWTTFIFALDRAIKVIVSARLPLNTPIPVLKPLLYFTHIQNHGAAFGMLQHRQGILIASGLLVLVFVWYYHDELWSSTNGFWGSIFLVAGDLGNLIDRAFYRSVTDFIDFRIWPIFNLADICINIGIGLVLWDFWFKRRNVS